MAMVEPSHYPPKMVEQGDALFKRAEESHVERYEPGMYDVIEEKQLLNGAARAQRDVIEAAVSNPYVYDRIIDDPSRRSKLTELRQGPPTLEEVQRDRSYEVVQRVEIELEERQFAGMDGKETEFKAAEDRLSTALRDALDERKINPCVEMDAERSPFLQAAIRADEDRAFGADEGESSISHMRGDRVAARLVNRTRDDAERAGDGVLSIAARIAEKLPQGPEKDKAAAALAQLSERGPEPRPQHEDVPRFLERVGGRDGPEDRDRE